MKKILILFAAFLVVATGCDYSDRVKTETTVNYSTEDDSYVLEVEAFVGNGNVTDIEGGFAKVDELVNTVFSDADAIEHEEGRLGRTYIFTYSFNSTEELNDFVRDNSTDRITGVENGIKAEGYNMFVMSRVFKLDSEFSSFMDYYKGELITKINESELLPSTLREYSAFGSDRLTLYVDGDRINNNRSNEQFTLDVESFDLDFKFDDNFNLEYTTLIFGLNVSDFEEDLVDDIIERFEETERAFITESKLEDGVLYLTSVTDADDAYVGAPVANIMGVETGDIPECTVEESFLFVNISCVVEDGSYNDKIVAFDNDITEYSTITATIGGETVNLMNDSTYEESNLKMGSLIILVVVIILIILAVIVGIKMFKKHEEKIRESASKLKESSANLASKAKDGAVEMSKKTAVAVGEMTSQNEGTDVENVENDELAIAETNNQQVPLNIVLLLLVAFTLLAPMLTLNAKMYGESISLLITGDFISALSVFEVPFGITLIGILYTLKSFIVFAIVVLVVVSIVVKRNMINVKYEIIQLVSKIIYITVIVLAAVILIAGFSASSSIAEAGMGDNASVFITISTICSVIISGYALFMIKSGKIENISEVRIVLFIAYLLSIIVCNISVSANFIGISTPLYSYIFGNLGFAAVFYIITFLVGLAAIVKYHMESKNSSILGVKLGKYLPIYIAGTLSIVWISLVSSGSEYGASVSVSFSMLTIVLSALALIVYDFVLNKQESK